MKRSALTLLLLIVCALWLTTGCRSRTMEEAFRKTYPDEGYRIVYSEPYGDRRVAFYRAPFENGTEGLGVAVFEGGEGKGWQLKQAGAFHYPGDTAVDVARVDLGEEASRTIVYGYTDEKEAAKVEVVDGDDSIVNARMVDTGWRKIWYAFTTFDTLRLKVLAADGRVLYQVPQQDTQATQATQGTQASQDTQDTQDTQATQDTQD